MLKRNGSILQTSLLAFSTRKYLKGDFRGTQYPRSKVTFLELEFLI
jgi:hypothetical protein